MKNKEKNNNSKIVKLIISLVFIILTIIFLLKANSLGIIPEKYEKYMVLLIFVLALLNLISSICLFTKKKWPKIFAFLIYLSLTIGLVIGIYYINETNQFLDTMFKENASNTSKIQFLVLSKNDYKIEDINNKEIVYYEKAPYVLEAITELNKKIKPQMVKTDDITTINNSEIFFIDESMYVLIQDTMNVNPADYKVIYKVGLEIKEENEENNDNNKEKNKNEKSKTYYNVYLAAYDFSGSRIDLNKIVTINTKTNEILITNIHRYSYLNVSSRNQKNTLSNNGYYGIGTNIKALEDTFDIDIDYYFSIKTPALVKVVDALGGINYCSDQSYTTSHALVMDTYDDTQGKKLKVNKGCQHLNGIETLTVAREREAFRMGAVQRDKNTSAIMVDILEAAKKPSNITRYTEILKSMDGLFNTSIPRTTITDGAKSLLNEGWNIKNQTVTGSNGLNTVGFSNAKTAVHYLNPTSVKNCSNAIKALNK